MNEDPQIICIGAAHWDVIGRVPGTMRHGADMPGRMTRQPGGVALNIAVALAQQAVRVVLLAAVGRDSAGEALVREIAARGVITDYLHRPESMPTDSYMAIEDSRGLIGAIADSQTLESVGLRLLDPLADGRLGSAITPFTGMIALDGGLTHLQLSELAALPVLSRADLRLVPAAPDKAARLAPFLNRSGSTFYVNLEEAGTLCRTKPDNSTSAARAMLARGATRALVTDGAREVTDADSQQLFTSAPPVVAARRVTGAGDAFVATHMAQELRGATRRAALEHALRAASHHVASCPEI